MQIFALCLIVGFLTVFTYMCVITTNTLTSDVDKLLNEKNI